jgi:signal peptidase I
VAALLAIPAGSADALAALPPLERAIHLLTVLALAWIFAYPEPRRRADTLAAALAAGALLALPAAWYWWGQGVALGAAYYNSTADEGAWVVATLAALAGGVVVVARQRAPGWRAGLAVLGALLAGHFIHYLYPVARLDLPGAARWAEALALPAAAVVLYRRALAWPPAWRASLAAPAPAGRSALRAVAETVLIAALAYFAIELATGRFRVDGPSMQPGLRAGQYLLTDRLAYRLGQPQRGDVVVVRHPGGPATPPTDLVKRVIGLPGDTVSVDGGAVRVNGAPLVEPYLAEAPVYTGRWTLGPGEYFVLGDNRNDSSDSHIWGAVRREQITGKALLVYWPPPQWAVVRHYRWQ